MEIRSCDRRIDLARLSLFVRLFSTGLATSTALSLRLAVAHRQSPVGESRTSKITKKMSENHEENHRKSQGKSDHSHPFSSPSAQDLRPPCIGFSELIVFSGDGHLCGCFGGLGIWIRGLF
ncbi:hypothetical protein TIFTF001_045012 [Ficus carica]|uniref:Uncharacterized protein n=1 Tax=Ficus carica TaxID=3494 RepID=A0AA88DEI8_FICCA|nr:hypothetical protein TIFTF001_045012 [Ficus carica]